MVASDTRDPRFEYSHWHLLLIVLKSRKIKKREADNGVLLEKKEINGNEEDDQKTTRARAQIMLKPTEANLTHLRPGLKSHYS